MLAQLFLTPSGIMLDAALVLVDGASAAAVPQASVDGCSSSAGAELHAFDSVVGTEGSTFSLREPLVCAVVAPRPLPPLPRSVPRPRPLPLSAPARPARGTLFSLVESPKVATVASLALDRDLSFFAFETSPHCVIDPIMGYQHATFKLNPGTCFIAGHEFSMPIHTVSYAVNSGLQVTVRFLQGEDDVLVCPVGKHLLDGGDPAAILLLQLGNFSIIRN